MVAGWGNGCKNREWFGWIGCWGVEANGKKKKKWKSWQNWLKRDAGKKAGLVDENDCWKQERNVRLGELVEQSCWEHKNKNIKTKTNVRSHNKH